MEHSRNRTNDFIITTNAKTLFTIITDLKKSSWRSDIEKTVVKNNTVFHEYIDKSDYTEYTIIETIENSIYKLEFTNKIFKGKWAATITEHNNNECSITLYEELTPHKFITYILSLILVNLSRKQKQYIKDLKKHLENYTIIE